MNERSFTMHGMKTSCTANARYRVILKAAITCFIEKGFHATSMREIAQQAGVSLGNLYTCFPGKQQLIAEVAVLERRELEPLLQMLNQLSAPGVGDLRKILLHYRSLACAPEWAALAAECVAEVFRNSALASAFEANRQQLASALEAAIRRGVAAGKLKSGAKACTLAQLLLDGVEAEAMRESNMDAEQKKSAVLDLSLLNSLLLS